MYKPPVPEDDEPHDIPEFYYPARQHRASQNGTAQHRRTPGEYRTDERPGEPKIKRASLLREQQGQQARLEAEARQKTEKAKAVRNPSPHASGTSKSRSETGKSRAIREPDPNTYSRRPRQETSSSRIQREPDAPRVRGERDETDTILIARNRRSSSTGAYAPHSTAPQPAQRRLVGTSSTLSWRSQPRTPFTRKQVITTISLMVVMIVLFIPIALISKHNSSLTYLYSTPGVN